MLEKVKKFFQENKQFVLILFFAAVIRFLYIESIPPSLNWDEVSHGYNAFSILKTGKDEWGVTLPTIFRAYGDYKLPIYIYLTALSEALFGLNAFSVRLISALAGIATVVFSYLLTKKLFGIKTAVLASLLVAVEPWSLFLSRGAFEANLALAFIVSGVYFFLEGLEKPTRLAVSAVLFGLSLWTYNSARIFVPLFLVYLVILYRKKILEIYRKNKSTILVSVFAFLLFFLPMVWQLVNPVGQARYGWVAILDEGAIAQINENRATSDLNPALSRLMYNKGTYFVGQVGINWVSHFTPDFLFVNGGSHFQFSIPDHGIVYPLNATFLILGIYFLIKKKSREGYLVLGWFFLGPVASSLTREAPHVLRSITTLPAPMIIISVGVLGAWSWLNDRKKIFAKIFITAYLVALAINLINYGTILNLYRRNYSWSWQYGYKEAVDYVKANYDNYDKIVFTKKYGEPHEFILFHWPWDPNAYRNDPNLNRFFQSNWYWVDSFDKFFFVNDWQINEEGTGVYMFNLESKEVVDCLIDKCLLVTSTGNVPGEWSLLKTIDYLNGEPAFEIYTNEKTDI